jgi:GTP cyclohydrolase I
MESVISTMLAKLGINLKDENFKDTPERVARAFRDEIYSL